MTCKRLPRIFFLRPTVSVTRWWAGREQAILTESNFKPRKVPENAQTPTSRVHAVLARFLFEGDAFH